MHLNLIFDPTPYGFKLPSKTPNFEVIVHTPISKIGEIRAAVQPYPIWDIEYELEWARGDERMPSSTYNYLLGFYLNAGGPFADFLYNDPYDNEVTGEFFGLGDGTTTEFQLIRSIGIGSDIVQNLNGSPQIYNNSTLVTSGYTVSTTGIVTFTSAPAAGHVLTWTGGFFYRVRFANPDLKFSQFAQRIWEAKSVPLRSVILGSVLS